MWCRYGTFELLDTFESQDIPFVWGTVNLAAASEPDELCCLKTEDPYAWVCEYSSPFNVICVMTNVTTFIVHSFIRS